MLEPAIDTAGPMGRMVLTVLGVVAETELGFIRELRQRAGIDAGKAKGISEGPGLGFSTIAHLHRVATQGRDGGYTEIAKAVGCKRGNVYKTLKAVGLK